MLVNADITIYNKKYDPKTRTNIYKRTVLLGVSAYLNVKTNFLDGSVRASNSLIIRIPEEHELFEKYVEDKQYECMRDVNGFWTVGQDDLVILGVSDLDDVQGISALEKAHHRAYRVNGFSDNRRGINKHFKVVCE